VCPMWRSILSIAVLAAFVVLPQAAWGGTIAVPVPDLLGTYDCSKYPFAYSREILLDIPFDFVNARLIVRGILTPALVRGDGITRAAQEAFVRGFWSAGFFNRGGGVFGPMSELISGPFTYQIDWPAQGLWQHDMPSLDNPSPTVCRLTLGALEFLYDVPWLAEQPDPIYDFWRWDEGLEFVTPLTAIITEAYWELEGPTIPEPATLSLLALGALVILRRRNAIGRRRQATGCRL